MSHKIGSISALVWDTIMKQVAPGSLFNKVYFYFWIMHNRQANLPLAPTIECTSMFKQQCKTVFVQLLEKLFLLPSHSSTSFPWADSNYSSSEHTPERQLQTMELCLLSSWQAQYLSHTSAVFLPLISGAHGCHVLSWRHLHNLYWFVDIHCSHCS